MERLKICESVGREVGRVQKRSQRQSRLLEASKRMCGEATQSPTIDDLDLWKAMTVWSRCFTFENPVFR